MDLSVLDSRVKVHAALNYLIRTDKRPYAYTFDPPAGIPAHFGEVNSVEGVPIRDARPLIGLLSLDREGFELREHISAVDD